MLKKKKFGAQKKISSMDKAPMVSIGLPVYNGQNYLGNALDSILAQSFDNFELIICDNASTDRTEEICTTYAAKDSRIQYYRSEKNMGATKNFNLTFDYAQGKYFKWASHDDIIGKDFILKCVNELEKNTDLVLCYPKTGMINEKGKQIGTYDYPMNIDSPVPLERFHDLLLSNHNCVAVFGVIRSEILKLTPLIKDYVGSDRVLLMHIGLLGRLYEVPEYLFFRRAHPESSTLSAPRQELISWYNPDIKKRINFPEWRVFWESYKAIHNKNISLKDSTHCYLYMIKRIKLRWKTLLENILIAIRDLLCRTKSGHKFVEFIKSSLKRMGISVWNYIDQ